MPLTLCSMGSQINCHHHYPKPPLQINLVLAVSSAIRTVISSAPLSRDMFLPPRSTTAPSRPPPEPPPSEYVVVLEKASAPVCLRSSAPTHLSLCFTPRLSAGPTLIRPSSKPPWIWYMFISLLWLSLVFGVPMAVPPPSLIINHARARLALILFVKNPQRDYGVFWVLLCAFWHLFIVTEEDYVASASSLGLSKYLSAIEYQGNWLNPENKISRNVPFRSQKSHGLDLEKKSRVSLFVIAKD